MLADHLGEREPNPWLTPHIMIGSLTLTAEPNHSISAWMLCLRSRPVVGWQLFLSEVGAAARLQEWRPHQHWHGSITSTAAISIANNTQTHQLWLLLLMAQQMGIKEYVTMWRSLVLQQLVKNTLYMLDMVLRTHIISSG